MSFWQRITTIDRRILYIILFVVLMVPQFTPVVIPMKIDRMVPPLHAIIEELQAGDTVLISVEFGAVMYAEMMPVLSAVGNHLFTKGCNVLLWADSPDGAMFAQELVNSAPETYVWGKNIINFGYYAGYEAVVSSLCTDLRKTFPGDFMGNPTVDAEVIANVNAIQDIKLVFQLTGGGLGPLLWVRQAVVPYNATLATAVSSSMLASAVPYYESGQLKALLNGLVGAAEYEILTQAPAKGTAGMAGQSLGHLCVVTFVLIGNLAYFLQKRNPSSTPTKQPERSGGDKA